MKRALVVVAFVAFAACGDDGDAAPSQLNVVRLRTRGCGLAAEIATGFADDGGVIITAAHPLDGDSPVLSDEDPNALDVTALDLRADVALLAPIAMASERVPEFRAAEVGEAVKVIVIRDDLPTPIEATVRSVAPINFHDAVAGTVVQRDGLVLSISIVGGDSGAPVVGEDGRVLGMMFANAKESTESYAVAASEIERLLAAPPAAIDRPPC